MAAFGIRIYCYEHGTTTITLNFVAQRSGGSNDNLQFRIQRRKTGETTKTLASEPFFALTADKIGWGWVFIDEDVPDEGE